MDNKIFQRDIFPIILDIKKDLKRMSNQEFYSLWGNSNVMLRGYLHKRLEFVNEVLEILPESSYDYKYTLNKYEEEEIMAMYYIVDKNLIVVSKTLNIPLWLVNKCIKRKGDQFEVKYCDNCNLYYLSKKLFLEHKNETVSTPCPFCYQDNTEYPYAIKPKHIKIPEIKDTEFWDKAYKPFREMQITLKIYERMKQVGDVNKQKIRILKHLYESILWLFGTTTPNFPFAFIENCVAIGEEPDKMRESLLNFLNWNEKTVKFNKQKSIIEKLRVAENLLDLMNSLTHYGMIWSDDDKEIDYYTQKYIKYNIPLLHKVEKF